MDFSKKHQKTRKFIGEFCTNRDLSIRIGLIFDRFGLDYDRFDEKLVAHMIALENHEIGPNRMKSSILTKNAKTMIFVKMAYNRLNMAVLTLFSPILTHIGANMHHYSI